MNYKEKELFLKKKEKINIVIFVFATLIFASLTLFFLFTSKKDYAIYLIINIILTIIYLTYFVFYFTTIVSYFNSYNKLFEEINNAELRTRKVEIKDISKITINNILFYSYLCIANEDSIELLSLDKLDLSGYMILKTKSRYIVEANHA